MFPLISIIVPIYKIEQYVGYCIESIIRQTYKQLEIILVDDGGDDLCGDICNLYASKDPRIVVIHKENGGLVSARKEGVRRAAGTYIAYVDGDDWIEEDYIEKLYHSAEASKADMVCAGFIRDLESKTVSFTDRIPAGVYDDEKLVGLRKRMISYGSFYKPGISTYVWNKLFRRELLTKVQLLTDDRITVGEDAAVTYPALLCCSRVAVVEYAGYHYRQRNDSMLKQELPKNEDRGLLAILYGYLSGWADRQKERDILTPQIIDYVLSLCIIRFGGREPDGDYSAFSGSFINKKVIVYSAGTFGQKLVNRIKESDQCKLAAWVDDDYWEYRRACLDVDPVESVSRTEFDFILLATVNSDLAAEISCRLESLKVDRDKIISISVERDRKAMLKRYIDV